MRLCKGVRTALYRSSQRSLKSSIVFNGPVLSHTCFFRGARQRRSCTPAEKAADPARPALPLPLQRARLLVELILQCSAVMCRGVLSGLDGLVGQSPTRMRLSVFADLVLETT